MSDPLADRAEPASERRGLGPWRSGHGPEGWEPFPASAMEGSLADRFLEVSERFADRTALRSPAGEWTYAGLRADATAQAAAIAELVGERRRPVALLAAHDGPLVVALLATLLADGIIVVLDPVAPAEQNAHVLRESGASLLLHDAAHAAAAATLLTEVVGPVSSAAIEGLSAPGFVPPTSGPDDLAMLAFTSGTSGGSKGGAITHGVILNVVRGATNALGVGPDDRLPMLFPTNLGVAAYPLFIPLLNGGVLATLDVRGVGLAPFADFFATERITLAYLAPTIVRFLVDSLGGRSFPDLRMVALGGELVDREVVALTRALFGPDRVANGFGSTETGVLALYVLEPDEEPDGVVPAGYPAPDVELAILDEHGAPVGTGAPGEIAIASRHIFQGYWQHPEMSERVLSPDPQGRPGWRQYRTGDLGVLDAHGMLTVLGRADATVKVRGRLVVLGDVESDVQALAGITDASVVAVTTEGVTELVAVVATAPGVQLDAAARRRELLDRREAYRVPERWVAIEALPLLPNGKLDRQAVLDHATRASDATRRRNAPPTATEASVQRIWSTLLPTTPSSLDDDFFDLGGHSLLAAQMLIMVEEELGTTVPMSTMVDARTIREVAAVIDAIGTAPRHVTPTTVARVQAGDEHRPRLWFVHDLPGSAYRVRHLARAMGPDVPVWSFESPLLRGERNDFYGLDEFADRYVRDLLAAQPEGPYWLGGYCFGGICAYQMARQLTEEGHEVAFLAVVDVGPGYRGPSWRDRTSPPWPYFGVPTPPPPGSGPVESARHYASMVAANPKGAARHLTLRTGAARHVDRWRFEADLRRDGRVRPSRRLWYAWEQHWHLAAKEWDRTSPYPGAMHLLWASQTGASDPTMGWGPLVDHLEIDRISGAHEDLLEEHGVADLATTLRRLLDETIEHKDRP